MKTARAAAVLALLAGLISAEVQSLDLLRLLMERPVISGYHRWDRRPGIEERLDHERNFVRDAGSLDRGLTAASSKRSAVATALNAGRPRRQPAPALGILNDMETFFEALRGNLEGMASLTPDERATFYDTPNVVRPPASDLTTADHWWRTTFTRGPTATTRACCGRGSDGRPQHPLITEQPNYPGLFYPYEVYIPGYLPFHESIVPRGRRFRVKPPLLLAKLEPKDL